MPPAKTRNNGAKVAKLEVVLPDIDAKKSVVKFTTEERPVELTNIYLGVGGYRLLGNPKAIKVTIEPYDGDGEA